MKVLVIGGLHGNEPLGLELYDSLCREPLPNVDVLLGNPAARRLNRRFVEKDLNRVFPGNENGVLEERRAVEIMRRVAGYDVVLDFHNTHCPDNDCAFVGGADYERLLSVASQLGLQRVIVADYDCVNKYVPGCLSVEISLGSPRCSVEHWRNTVGELAALENLSLISVTLYEFLGRVTKEDQVKFGFKGWRAFQPLPQSDRVALGLTGSPCPIFIGDSYTPGQYAALVRPRSEIGVFAD
jgi:hypothetical protein